MRLVLRTLLAAVVLLFAVIAWFGFTPFALEGVAVIPGECNHNPFTVTSAQGSWDGPIHQLAIEKSANCSAYLESAAVQRLGSHLFVRTRFEQPSADVAAGCNCGHRVNLRIPGLPQGTYQAHVYAWP